jgi:hypothetical protein
MAMLKAGNKHWQFQAQIEERKERAGEVRFAGPFLSWSLMRTHRLSEVNQLRYSLSSLVGSRLNHL